MRAVRTPPALVVVLLGVASFGVSSHGIVRAQSVAQVVASGLDNPRGLAFGPEGALYVTEAGRGGSGPCVVIGANENVCFGLTGAVTRIWRGGQERLFTGLPSLATAAGQATGPDDVSFQGRGNGYVTFGLARDPATRALLGPAGAALGHLARFTPSGEGGLVADITGFEAATNPDGGVVDSNPYAVLALPQGTAVADAGANAVFGVLPNGTRLTLATFAPRPNPLFGTVGGPVYQSVPNALAHGPDGAIYVGELTGFPFVVGEARVYRLVPGQAPTVYRSGFTNIIDLAFGPDGSLYVLQIAANGLRSGPFSSIVRVYPDGTRSTLDVAVPPPPPGVPPGLFAATGLAVGPDGALYVSNRGILVGVGQVLRIEP
jgi:hypothetical protein